MSKRFADARLPLEDFCVPFYCCFGSCHNFDGWKAIART
jgi:hypothetical protein